jgi:hypothetical protein
MKKTPFISDGKTPLVWRKHPYGGHYAGYKMGTILRYKGTYSIILDYKGIPSGASSLIDAKARIDKHTDAIIRKQKQKK